MSAPNGTIIEDEQTFLDDVEAFYKARGVPWERDAKVAGRPISLHQLYKTVMDIGGYDKISAERMRWRTLVQPFGLGTTHEPAMTFQLKTVYYKNLAAYEIAHYWGETPPPPQILEDLTAKGGDLRNRRIETYPLQSRNQEGRDSEDEELQKTPVKDKMEPEEPGSGRRYPTRELRQDPKRTQLYQPDPTPQRTRHGRTTSSPQASPAPTHIYANASTDPRNPSFSIDNYQPRQPIALTLRSVITPGNAAEVFYQRKAMEKQQAKPRLPGDPKYLELLKQIIPPSHRSGPSIYTRCHMGLQSGIREEQAFALHHLVKVSYERGDKFTFRGFPHLAEALIEKALQISQLVHGIKWHIAYDQEEGKATLHALNGCFGTPKLMESVRSFKVVIGDTDPETDDFIDDLERINEAALVIRNMLTLEENARAMSENATFKDFLIIAINLPQQPRLTEFRQYALEMAEMTTRYWAMASNDPLYLSLVAELESQDRGRILSALRAINHIGVETDHVFQISDIPSLTLERIVSFILLDDDELVEASLDFLYEFTAISSNVTSSLQQSLPGPPLLPSIVPKITSLLLHNAVTHEEKIQNRPFPNRQLIKGPIPTIPNDLYVQLLQYPEPERSSRWLRCCFEESPQDDITQIAIWQAYQGRFSQTGHIAAADFIKNVSSTFHQAQAQVINTGAAPRFIIKGIKPRQVLVDVQGRSYFKCLWESNQNNAHLVYDGQGRQRHVCGTWHSTRPNVWYHILQDHCGLQRGSDGKFTNAQASSNSTPAAVAANGNTNDSTVNGSAATTPVPTAPTKTFKCNYLSCPRTSPFNSASELGIHIRGHIPENADAMSKLINELSKIPAPNEVGMPRQKEPTKEEMYTHHAFFHTPTDERGHPCGISFMSVMVLRNLARYVGRFGGKISSKMTHHNSDSIGSHSPNMRRKEKSEIDRKQELMSRIFSPDVRNELWYVLSVHRTLGNLVNDLMNLIEKGEAGEKKKLRDDVVEEPVEPFHQEDNVVAR